MSSESTSPAAANAIIFAVRKRSRSGAASSELVIVWWRHSPVIPITARIVMKRLLVSEVKTSVEHLVLSRLVQHRNKDRDEQRGADRRGRERQERARGAQLEQLGAQERRHVICSFCSVSSKKASSSERV